MLQIACHVLVFLLVLPLTCSAPSRVHTAQQPTQQATATAQTPSGCARFPHTTTLPSILPDSIQQVLIELDAFYNSTSVSQQLPGFITVLVYKDRILFDSGYGRVNFFDPSSPPPNIDSIVRIASITKTFTALLSLLLEQEGAVDLDAPVQKYMPDFSMRLFNSQATHYKHSHATHAATTDIPVRSLLSHSSGLPRENPCQVWGVCNETTVLQMLKDTFLLFTPYQQAYYSNLGFSLLGRTLEHAVDESYESLMQSLFLTLSMLNSTVVWQESMRAHLAVGVHDGAPAPIEQLGWDAPCGAAFSTARDMATFIMSLFSTTPPPPFTSATYNSFLTSSMPLRDGRSIFGIPWELNYSVVADAWLWSKAGSINGYRSQISLSPKYKLGVFHVALQDDVNDDSVWTTDALEMVLPVLSQYLYQQQTPVPLPNNVDNFIGNYDSNTSIYESNGVMYFQFSDTPLLEMSGYDFSLSTPAFQLMISDVSNTICRWLHDGSDQQIAYFIMQAPATQAVAVRFMGNTYKRINQSHQPAAQHTSSQ